MNQSAGRPSRQIPRPKPMRRAPKTKILGFLCVLLASLLPGCSGPKEERVLPPIVFIVFDTTRLDHLSFYDYERKTTPNLDRVLGRDTVRFDQMTAAANNTSCAHASMFTGLHVKSHGVRMLATKGNGLRPSFPTLAEKLQEEGYFTVGAVSVFHLNPNISGLGRGFEEFVECPLDSKRPKQPAEETNKRLLPVLKKAYQEQKEDRPLFLFAHYFDPHHAYHPLPHHLEKFPASEYKGLPVPDQPDGFSFHDEEDVALETARQTAMYDAEILRADEALGHLFDTLEELGILEEAIIVFTADHGENLGENNLFASHSGLFKPVIHTPLAIRIPGITENRTEDAIVHQTDLMPTLLDAAGIPEDHWPQMEGKSLLELLGQKTDKVHDFVFAEAAMFREKMVRDDRYKLIYDDSHQKAFLYDLENDSNETTNLADKMPEKIEYYLEKLDAYVGKTTYFFHQTAPASAEQFETIRGEISSLRELSITTAGLEDDDSFEFSSLKKDHARFDFRLGPEQDKGLCIVAHYGPLLLNVASNRVPIENCPVWYGDAPRSPNGFPIVVRSQHKDIFPQKAASKVDGVVTIKVLEDTDEQTRWRLMLGPIDSSAKKKGMSLRVGTNGTVGDIRPGRQGTLGFKHLGGGHRFRVGSKSLEEPESLDFTVTPGRGMLFIELRVGNAYLNNTHIRIENRDDPRAYPTTFLLSPNVSVPVIDAGSIKEYVDKPGFHLWSKFQGQSLNELLLSPEEKAALESLGYIGGEDGKGKH